PGCGDYAILSAVQSVFPELGIPREKFVVISGIGCSSRFPYYMNTFGFHSIHGRAPAVATGLKIMRPDLEVWVATGDGDALSIGGNHTIHMLRRNVGLKVLLFNNRIYGLTKGQYSPTSELHKKTKSTPYGSADRPFNPISLAIGSEATFVARSVDVFQQHLKETLRKAAAHRGSAYIEILQNCNIFNDGAWEDLTEKDARSEHVVQLEHGKPLIFGKNRDKGIRLNELDLEVVQLGGGVSEKDLLVHDEKHPRPAYAFMLAHMEQRPGFPTPIGVLRAWDDVPRYEDLMNQQIRDVVAKRGAGDIAKLLRAGDTWEVK
ncbi:MAG TPA: 2-oxoacid:ferredoxin oxidoreductase subunit beta, partial [Candidatus Acidoferrales bacterium]|nr:2-oxoacid:ferredoxin oxidoreductase subunit beta [Candidatus Acidoferrales bacterium]